MTKLWFKAKEYGYGWYPSTCVGCAVTIGYVILLLSPLALLALLGIEYASDVLFPAIYVPYAGILTFLLLWICVKKGEKAGWRWGGR